MEVAMDVHLIVIAGLLLSAPVLAEIRYDIPLQGDDDNLVKTKSGWVRGFTQTINEVKLRTFFGIPYANPPLRELRFRRPQRIKPWTEVKNVTRRPSSCFQAIDTMFNRFPGVEMWNPNTAISEDCLYLNIWSPVKSTKKRSKSLSLAVMVWIYGGGFYSGTSTLDIYDAAILASHTNVVVASMQYRVGPLGFLYLNHDRAPGNVGLLDQALALRWIKDNIASFGGDPNRITLFGESAGAVSVSYQLLSPISRDFFANAVMQSGSAFCPWATQSHDKAMTRSIRLAEICGCKSKKLDELMDCLIDVDPRHITNGQWNETIISDYFDVPIGPVTDGFFLPEHPVEILRKGLYKKTNVLLGSNKDEGSYFLLYGLIDQYFKFNHTTNLSRQEFLDALRVIVDPSVPQLIMDAIVFEYELGQTRQQRGTYRDVMDDISGDFLFICPTNDFAAVYSDAGADVYMYRFLHRSSVNPWPKWMGVMHGYEIEFVFGKPMNKSLKYTPEEKKMSKRMMKFWSNFAKHGNPNGERNNKTRHKWPKYELHRKDYLILNADRDLKVGHGPRTRQCAFWREYIPRLRMHIQKTREGARCGCCRHMSVGAVGLVLLEAILYHIFH